MHGKDNSNAINLLKDQEFAVIQEKENKVIEDFEEKIFDYLKTYFYKEIYYKLKLNSNHVLINIFKL